MKENLIKHIEKLNKNINNFEDEVTENSLILLPLFQYSKFNNKTLSKKIESKLNSDNIKSLRYFNFNDYMTLSDKIDMYLSEFSDEIIAYLPENIDFQSINFLLYELLINIYKHSKFNNAFIQINTSPNNDEIEICIIDDGIGIIGSFNEESIKYENDSDAIFKSINGTTTDKEKFNLHGRGLNTSARIATLGFNGNMLIASGKGICDINSNGAKTYYNPIEINGTFILLKLNNKKVDNLYECIEYKTIDKIEGVNDD